MSELAQWFRIWCAGVRASRSDYGRSGGLNTCVHVIECVCLLGAGPVLKKLMKRHLPLDEDSKSLGVVGVVVAPVWQTT